LKVNTLSHKLTSNLTMGSLQRVVGITTKGVFVSQLTAVENTLRYAINISLPNKTEKRSGGLHAPVIYILRHRIYSSIAL